MSNEKKPSIYQDRGTIGSARELDEYGVWVKSEPQDLVSGEVNSGEDDFSLDKLPDFPAEFDAFPDPDFTIPEESFTAGDSAGEEGIDGLGDLPDFSIDDFSLSGDDSVQGGEDFSLEGGTDFSPDGSGAAFSPEGAPGFSLGEEDLDLSLPEEAPALETGEEGPEAGEKTLETEEEAPEAGEEGSESPASGDDDGDFEEISLEDFLGGVADEFPGEESPEEAEAPASADKSTQLLMKIAEELSSIRAELSALKKEFSAARGTEGESRGFFEDADTDDKIALTGDELNNILNTADFTEETGADAAEGAPPDFSEGDTPGAFEGVSPETSADELSLDDQAEPAGELEAPAGEEALIDFGEIPEVASLEDLEVESLEDAESPAELSLADLSIENDSFAPGEDADTEIAELSPAEPAVILEEAGNEEAEDSGELDISLDAPFSGEEISLENFEEGALDLSSAVIEEPDLGAEIRENPVLEPALDDIALFDEDLGEAGGGLPPESPLESPDSPDGEGAVEISAAEEETPELPPARARGEDLDQIIPEGFVIEEPEDEISGLGDLDPLEEGIPLDEIPEAVLPEEDEAPERGTEPEGPEEPEISVLPGNFKTELKQVLSYMDQLLESLPEEKIEEFAKSEYFDTYKKLFKDLGLV